MTAPGIVFPQAETAGDVGFAREYAVAAEELGYGWLFAYEHVLGADSGHYDMTGRPYDHESPFWEPFVLFGHWGGITSSIQLVLGVLVLPMRQTALVAKQVATLDLLCDERFVLGVGVGWNPVEYEAMGQDFTTRGRRIEEQIPLLRRLWTEDLVTHEGEFDTIRHAGILPRPRRPIPLWMGGWTDGVLERLGRLADGWMTSAGSPASFRQPNKIHHPDDLGRRMAIMHDSARKAGRDPSDIGVNMGIAAVTGTGVVPWDPEDWVRRAAIWSDAGATQVTYNTLDLGFSPPDHLKALEQLADLAPDIAGRAP